MQKLIFVALFVTALAGCLDNSDLTGAESSINSLSYAHADVVVAVIDSGTNPYHEAFQRESLSAESLALISNDGVAPRVIQLTRSFETFEENFEADRATWEGIKEGELIYFAGTNLLGVSFQNGIPILDDPSDAHGTGTTGAVTYANPDAIVVLVEGTNTESEKWAAAQPWIDVISMSYGPPGSVPLSGPVVFGLDTHVQTKLMWGRGAIPVAAADNTPSLAINDESAGPPWVIGVAGDHPEEGAMCREHISGTFPDVTADFTQDLPASNSMNDTRENYSGTSFSTPRTAGTVSAIIQQVRANWTHFKLMEEGILAKDLEGNQLTNEMVRDALYRAAYYFDFTACPPSPDTALPVNPAAPWAQMGWGHVGPDVVPAAVNHLLGLELLPEKDAGAVAFQGSMMAYRTALWSNI